MNGTRRSLWMVAGLVLSGSACGPPTLVPLAEGPGADGSSAVAQGDAVTLVASKNRWFESELAEVCTPLHVIVSNESKHTLTVAANDFSLVDERGQVYRALPAKEVIRRLFGTAAAMQPAPPSGPPEGEEEEQPVQSEPPTAPPEGSPPPPPAQPAPPPAQGGQGPGQGTDTLAPVPPAGISPVADVGVVEIAGHSGGAGAGAHGSPGGFHGPNPSPNYRRNYGHGGYGGYGYGRPWGWSPGWGHRLGYGYWGAPLWWAGAWGWWFAPYYVGGIDSPYYYDPEQVEALEEFGPWQVHTVALRQTELKPNQRMGGLVFFDPAWKARLVTLRFDDHLGPGLSVRFEVR